MNKKYIIVSVLTILIAVGYFYYKDRSKEEDSKKWHEKEYARVVEIANKSPRAGLNEMGRSLEKYYTDNKSYPAGLADLYPKYIANKALIEDVKWEYVPGKNNFMLKKSVIIKGKTLVASIDNNLKPVSGQTTTMAASSKSANMTYNKDSFSNIMSGFTAAVDSKKEENIISASLIDPQFMLVKETENVPDFENEISRKYLAWKDDKGVRGFGNIQYPHIARISIYSDGKQYDLKRSAAVKRALVSDKKSPGNKPDLDIIASEQSEKYLVWKDKNGNLGFGNLQYPDDRNVAYINVDGKWRKTGS